MDDFFTLFDDFPRWAPNRQVDYIAFYLIKVKGAQYVTSKLIEEVREELDLKKHKRLAQYLSESASAKRARYVRGPKPGLYRLERSVFEEIDRQINNEPTKVAVSEQLTNLVASISDDDEKAFLEEAINCYRIQANRAAIILVWIVAMSHLQKYIFANKLNEFNTAFALNPDRRMNRVVQYDDFSAIGESKFIEVTKSAGIISNDVRKILDEKLGTRNSAAHPSGVTFTAHKATEFALDIISNILLKY